GRRPRLRGPPGEGLLRLHDEPAGRGHRRERTRPIPGQRRLPGPGLRPGPPERKLVHPVTACLACEGPLRMLAALNRTGTPHGRYPPGVTDNIEPAEHNFQFEYTAVFDCATCAHGDLRQLLHDCFQPPYEDPWDSEYTADIPPDDMARLRTGLASCPEPTRFDCDC